MNKSMDRFLPLPIASIMFILAFVAGMLVANPLFSNPDTPWHLAAGDLIRASGLPVTDIWSYTANGAPWYNLSCACDLLISVIVAHTGLYGLYFFTVALTAVLMAVLATTLKARALAGDFYIMVTLVLVWYVLVPFFFPQPWLMTFLFVALFHHLLHVSRSQNDWRALRWLPLMMIAWVNLHGGFAIGLSLIAVYIIEARQARQQVWCKRLCLCLAACAAACLINPYGIYIVPGFLRTMHSVITPYLQDWQPVIIGTDISLVAFLLFFIVCTNLRDKRLPTADKILALGWLIYAIHTRRNFIIFAIVSAPYFVYNLQEFARYAQGAAFKVTEHIAANSTANRKKFAAIALITLALFCSPLKTALVPDKKLSDDPYDVRAAITALKPYAKTRFINDYNIGGYLIYTSGGAWPLFVDGRAGTAYSEGVLKDSIALANLKPGYEKIFDTYKADGVILHNTHRFAEVLRSVPHSGWKQVYTGESISAYVRRKN